MSNINRQLEQALAALQSGKPTEAEAIYRRVLQKKPRDITTLYHLGVALHQQAKTEEARRVFVKTVKNAPDFAEAHFSLGIVLIDLKRHDGAEKALRMALTLRPEMQIALSRLGELLIVREKYSEAPIFLKKAIQIREDDTKAWTALVQAFRHLDLLEEAIAANNQLFRFDDSEKNHSEMANLIYLLFRRDQASAQEHAHKWLELFPDSVFAQHIASGILGLQAPERASSGYVKELFDDFAETFESQLTKLGYKMPDIITDIANLNGSDGNLVILDAGCGTGLAAKGLRQKANYLVGVDISPRMLEKAADKGIYDELVEMDLGAFLKHKDSFFDLIVANDVFIYFGDLASIINDATHALCPDGKLVFSVEKGVSGNDFTLGAHGRYSHDKDYVVNCIEQAGLQISKVLETCLRHEFGKEVNAFLVCATKPK